MKILRFHPAESTTRQVPDRKTIESFEDASGKWRERTLVHSYKTVRNDAAFQKLEIYTKDLSSYGSALAWRVGLDDELNFPPASPGKGEFTSVEIRGQIEGGISADEVHEIVEDYRLLRQHFSSYSDIFRGPLSASMTEQILYCLVMAISNSEDLQLPGYILRVLELRKQHKK